MGNPALKMGSSGDTQACGAASTDASGTSEDEEVDVSDSDDEDSLVASGVDGGGDDGQAEPTEQLEAARGNASELRTFFAGGEGNELGRASNAREATGRFRTLTITVPKHNEWHKCTLW